MSRPWTWWLAWGLCAVFAALTLATILLDRLTQSPYEREESFLGDLSLVLAFAAFAAVGALVASRQPRNAVGWLFLSSPLLAIIGAFSEEYAFRAFMVDPGMPAGLAFGWLYGWIWFPAIGAIGLVPLLFPDGRLPGRRWRPLLWAYVGVISLTAIGAALYPGPIDDTWPLSPEKPLTIDGAEGLLETGAIVAAVALPILLVALLASMVVRFRRSRGDERQQLKWMLVAVAFLVAEIVLTETVPTSLPDGVVNTLFALSVASIPAAAGVAILKYRLYDVDLVIRKTLIYGSLTALLGALYAAVVVVTQILMRPLTGGSNLAIAVSTLVVAALFLPVRSRVQSLVDRRFYRRRYDAQRTLEAFGARLRQQVDLPTLSGDLRGVVTETMQPAHVSLWLRSGARP